MLLVPGLWTKWHPLYWVHLRAALDACAIDYVFSKSDTDLSLEENTKVVHGAGNGRDFPSRPFSTRFG